MRLTTHLTAVVAGLVLLMAASTGWSGPPNPTGSDANENTAGGTNALANVVQGVRNTAFGFNALGLNTIGSDNTAIDERRLAPRGR